MAQSVTDSMAMSGFKNMNHRSKNKKPSIFNNSAGFDQLNGDMTPGAIITTPDGQKMMVGRDGQLSPIGGTATSGFGAASPGGAVQVVAGPTELDPAERRKLFKELKDELKPKIS